MLDEMRQSLQGWPQGEEALEYIEHLEEENRCLNKIFDKHKEGLDKICELVEEYMQECPYSLLGIDLDCENNCSDNLKKCWKQYALKRMDNYDKT